MLRNRAKRKYGTVTQEIQFSGFYQTAIFQNIPQDHSFQIQSQGLTLYVNIPRSLSSVYGNIFLTLPLDACKNGLRALFLQ